MKPADSPTLRAPAAHQAVAGVVLLATLTAGLIVSVGLHDARARDTTLRAPYPIAGVLLAFPPIGTTAAQCAIVHAWADRSAIAWCAADATAWRFDPRTMTWYPLNITR